MQLNSILFPAPKSSYSIEQLKGELLWVPKYKKVPVSFSRASTLQHDHHPNTHFSSSTTTPRETQKNMVPKPRKKKSMPKHTLNQMKNAISYESPAVSQKKELDQRYVKTEMDDIEFQGPYPEPNYNRIIQPSFTLPSEASDSPNISVLEVSHTEDEPFNLRMPMKANNLKVKNSQTVVASSNLNIKQDLEQLQQKNHNHPNMNKVIPLREMSESSSKESNKENSTTESSLNSHRNNTTTSSPMTKQKGMKQQFPQSLQLNLSTEEEDNPPIANEKKDQLNIAKSAEFGSFTLLRTPRGGGSPSQQHKKSQFEQIQEEQQAQQKAAAITNTPQQSFNSTRKLFKEESKTNFEQDIYDEYPNSSIQLSSPKNFTKYQTRILTNPNVKKIINFDRNHGHQTARNHHHHHHHYHDTSKGLNIRQIQKSNTLNNSYHHSHSLINHKKAHLPKQQFHDVIDRHIPCLLLKSHVPTQKIMLYFHGNGEDIYLAYDLLTHIRNNLNINVLAIEYPGYGLYKGAPNDDQILADSEAVYDYLTVKLKHNPKHIIIFGRSIGSGPASWLAARKSVGALVLMSAFTSIRAVVRDLAGKWAQFVIKERFNNVESMQRVNCPSFLIHGLRDNLIPYKQSQELHNACKGPCELILPKEMDHIEFDFYEDFTAPLAFFLTRCNFELRPKKGEKLEFPKELFEIPFELKRLFKKSK